MWSVAALLCFACEGNIGEPGGTPNRERPVVDDPSAPSERPPFPEEPPYVPPSFVCEEGASATGSTARVVRLTADEYALTIQEAFRRFRANPRNLVPPSYEAPFADRNPADRYSTYAISYGMADDELVTAMDAARTLAASFREQLLVATGDTHEGACEEVEDRTACVRAVLSRLGRVLYRRPLSEEELDGLELTYAEVASVSHATGFEASLRRLFASPQFLYRDEVARGPERRLDAHQVAAALSYTLRGGPPDSRLERASEAEGFTSEASIRETVLQLLGENLGQQPRVLRFLQEYTRLANLDLVFKDPGDHGWYQHERNRSANERFFGYVLDRYGREGFFQALLTDPSVFVNRNTYRHFFPDDETSASEWGEGADFVRVELPEQRRGFLTQPGFLVTHSHSEETHPVGRGHFIASSLMCVTIPPVPIGVVAALPEIPGATMRERLSEHSREPCAGCHSLMDDVGLAFEIYDDLGRFRETEEGRPIETGGTLRGSDSAVAFADTFALIDALAASREARECFVLQSFEYWLGRRPAQADGCTLVRMYEALHEAGDFVEMLLVLFSSESFLAQQEVSE